MSAGVGTRGKGGEGSKSGKRKPRRRRIPVHLTLDEQVWTLAKEKLPNVSQTVERLLKMALNLEPSVEIVRIGDLRDRGVAWSILPAREADYMKPIQEMDMHKESIGEIEPPKEDNIFSKALPTKEQTLNELWNKHKDQYLEFLKIGVPPKHKPVSEGTVKDYTNALTKFFNQYTINNWKELMNALMERNMPKQLVNGLGKFITFLEFYEYITPEEAEKWRKGIARKRSGVKPAERFEKAKLDKILKGYKKLISMEKLSEEDKLGNELLFKFMFYTGQRMQHALEILKKLKENPELLKFEDNIAYTSAEFVSKGKKRSFIAVMPREFGEYLKKNIKKAKFRNYDTYRARFQDHKVNATAIRTWFSTFLAENKVPFEVINFLTGKVPESVLAKHYLDLSKLAKEEYKKIAEKFPKLD